MQGWYRGGGTPTTNTVQAVHLSTLLLITTPDVCMVKTIQPTFKLKIWILTPPCVHLLSIKWWMSSLLLATLLLCYYECKKEAPPCIPSPRDDDHLGVPALICTLTLYPPLPSVCLDPWLTVYQLCHLLIYISVNTASYRYQCWENRAGHEMMLHGKWSILGHHQ